MVRWSRDHSREDRLEGACGLRRRRHERDRYGSPLDPADGATLSDVLGDLESPYPGITKNVISEDGGLHRFINVYVNDEDVRYLGSLETEVADGDTVSILPAVAGGSL